MSDVDRERTRRRLRWLRRIATVLQTCFAVALVILLALIAAAFADKSFSKQYLGTIALAALVLLIAATLAHVAAAQLGRRLHTHRFGREWDERH